jgi:hypothetical protein
MSVLLKTKSSILQTKKEVVKMNTVVLIENLKLTEADLEHLNANNEHGIVFGSLDEDSFLPEEIVFVIIQIAQNIGYNAIYDSLKFVVSKVINLTESKIKNNYTKIEFQYNDNKASFSCNFTLAQEQKNEIIETILEKMLNN